VKTLSTLSEALAYIGWDRVKGWFSGKDAALLFDATALALREFPDGHVVEIGSYQGRSTIVLGAAVRSVGSTARVYAIDPHEGFVPQFSAPGERHGPTWDVFLSNVRGAGLLAPDGPVDPIRLRSLDVESRRPISMLFLDGAHEAVAVLSDWIHFAPDVAPGRYVAFHDYGNTDFPGVRRVVDSLIESGVLERFSSCSGKDKDGSLIVLKRLP